jgi:hypothetical protein
MKISKETLSILHNFSSINQGILFRKGSVIRTVSPLKSIMAEATIGETIPDDFAIYDLNTFLSVLTVHKEEPQVDVSGNDILISGMNGRSVITYRACAPNMITSAPDKSITMPSKEIVFDLSSDSFDWIMRTANILSSPQICVRSDGKTVDLVSTDIKNDSAHTNSLKVCEGNGDVYNMIFKTENIKIIPGSYSVTIASKGIANFKNKEKQLQYWITTEQESKFQDR